uniref:Uncharacterized protein n=1 Tax=Populus trichocarpa TaxID=3694 RepID=A0A2K2AQZ8_POPTR
MHVHGFDICSCRGKSLFSDSTELLMEPLQLVVQFHRWKASGLLNAQSEVETGDAVQSSKSQQEMLSRLENIQEEDYIQVRELSRKESSLVIPLKSSLFVFKVYEQDQTPEER